MQWTSEQTNRRRQQHERPDDIVEKESTYVKRKREISCAKVQPVWLCILFGSTKTKIDLSSDYCAMMACVRACVPCVCGSNVFDVLLFSYGVLQSVAFWVTLVEVRAWHIHSHTRTFSPNVHAYLNIQCVSLVYIPAYLYIYQLFMLSLFECFAISIVSIHFFPLFTSPITKIQIVRFNRIEFRHLF